MEVGGKLREYGYDILEFDKITNPRDMAKHGLMRRSYRREDGCFFAPGSGVETGKCVEIIFGYNVYHVLTSSKYAIAWIAPAMIVDKDGKPTGYVLKRFLRTTCNRPEIWLLICDMNNKNVSIKEKPEAVSYLFGNKYWTDPTIPIDNQIIGE